MTGSGAPGGPADADGIARTAREHPCVVRLDGGPFGVIATPLPGRTVVGVRAVGSGEPVEVGVVVRPDRPLPELVTEIRDSVRALLGAVPVDITVADVATGAEDGR